MAEVGDAKQSSRREGKLRWVLGWIVLPGTIISALFLTGVHVGARHPDMGLSRLLLKVFGAKPGVTEPKTRHRDKPRPGAKPGETFEFTGEMLAPEQLQTIADDNLGLDVADLDCEDICRAYAKAKYDVPVYEIDGCEFLRAVKPAPSTLVCTGRLEAIEPVTKQPTTDKPADAKTQ